MTGDLPGQLLVDAGGLLEFRRQIEQFRWLTLVPIALDAIVAAWINTARLSGVIRSKSVTHTWTAPRWDWVDPVKTSPANCSRSPRDSNPGGKASGARGLDPDENIRQIQETSSASKRRHRHPHRPNFALGLPPPLGTRKGTQP